MSNPERPNDDFEDPEAVAFEGLMAQAREHYRKCPDGRDTDHFQGLVALGYCPWCGTEAAP